MDHPVCLLASRCLSPPVRALAALGEGWHFALCSVPPKNLINVVELWAFIQKLQLGRSHAWTEVLASVSSA